MSYIGPRSESREGNKCLSQTNGEISYYRNLDNSSSSPCCKTSNGKKEICDVDLCYGRVVFIIKLISCNCNIIIFCIGYFINFKNVTTLSSRPLTSQEKPFLVSLATDGNVGKNRDSAS